MQLSYNIAEGDLSIKLKKAKEFLDEGHRVKIELKLKGRQNAHPDIGLQRVNDAVERLKGPTVIIEKQPTADGKMIWAQLRDKAVK